jgi:hypothetical protein
MLRILKFLFTGTWHKHVWTEIHHEKVSARPRWMRHETELSGWVHVGHSYIMECKVCGKRKEERFMI